MAIPLAYTGVVISANPNSHLQAIGIGARGRKQYRYHPDWSAERSRAKFEKLSSFADRLPEIKQRVDRDLALRKPTYEKALATVVHLMDNLYIRVGNASYAAENGSFGLTTLRDKRLHPGGCGRRFHVAPIQDLGSDMHGRVFARCLGGGD
jgi:DNA topoisomerase-1